MKKSYHLFAKSAFALFASLWLFSAQALAQTTVSGTVTDADTKETLVGANIKVKEKVVGTVTDLNGKFSLKVNAAPPFTLQVSVVGYQPKEVEVTANNVNLSIELAAQTILGQEVVVSASRVEESVLKSPVSVERMDILQVRETPAANFYDALNNMKGVEMSTQSLTFKSVTTRGFNANGNVRMVQMIDGMDNQAPGLNFSVGNIVGISELDLENMELLPGAASALYGPNAINGILLMNSKSPFDYQGASAYVRTGLMNEAGRRARNTGEELGATGMIDVAARYAKAFNNKFAFKLNVGYLQANDWQANDLRDQSLRNGSNLASTRQNNLAYNGVNVYGDETTVNMFNSLFANGQPGTGAGGTSPILGAIATFRYPQALPGIGGASLLQLTGQTPQAIFQSIIPGREVSDITRTGYLERDLADYTTKSLKLNGSLHYRLSDNVEAIIQGNFGFGTSVYTGAGDRYSLSNFRLSQIKAEVRGSNFYVRAYTTQERSGESYAIGILGSGINEAWKPSQTWYPQYFGNFAQNALTTFATTFAGALGQGLAQPAALEAARRAAQAQWGTLHEQSRALADQGRLLPGTPDFETAFEEVKTRAIPGNARGVGAFFLDRTNLYHAEFMYNFKKIIDPKTVDIVVGGNFRTYDLNSGGTLFLTKADGSEYNINEFGGYVQAQKNLFEERLKLTGSLRYDKNQNFRGQLSPRVSAVFTAAKTHNFRASYQTGFRLPTTQNQYINLSTPSGRLIGATQPVRDQFGLDQSPLFTVTSIQANPTNPARWERFNLTEFNPERVLSFEVGYKGLIAEKLLIDAYYYRNDFRNFIGGQQFARTTTNPQAPLEFFSMPVNFSQSIITNGWALGADYSLPEGFTLGGNVSFNQLVNEDDLPFLPEFNTPNYRYNLSLANRNLVKNLSFGVTWRWQESFVWQSGFVSPAVNVTRQAVIPAFGTLDAQVSLKVPSIKSIIKLGGSNLLNQQYIQGWGNPTVGALYYLQITFDEFLN
jgi:outer membrane receptor protein involved in Fe transport